MLFPPLWMGEEWPAARLMVRGRSFGPLAFSKAGLEERLPEVRLLCSEKVSMAPPLLDVHDNRWKSDDSCV